MTLTGSAGPTSMPQRAVHWDQNRGVRLEPIHSEGDSECPGYEGHCFPPGHIRSGSAVSYTSQRARDPNLDCYFDQDRTPRPVRENCGRCNRVISAGACVEAH